MKNKFLIGAIVLILSGEGYIGYEVNRKNIFNIPDLSKVNSGSVIVPAADDSHLYICSFNIQFLGSSKRRDNIALSHLLKDFDIIVIQELLAPPIDGIYPDKSSFIRDQEAGVFLNNMIDYGYEFILSEEDTGPGDKIHLNSAATEWWICFYKPDKVRIAADLPHGFLANDRSNNQDYDRVPFAFPFRTADSSDFVLISVHLAPGASGKQRRLHELKMIYSWINKNNSEEKDFIILGDMNIESKKELVDVLPSGYISLNDECRRTNTLINDNPDHGAKPYDHILYSPKYTGNEIDERFDLVVLDIVESLRPYWTSNKPYPGNPYDHNAFRQYYSDHNPIIFRYSLIYDDD